MFNQKKDEIRFIETDDEKLSDAFWECVHYVLEAIYDGVGIRLDTYNDFKSRHPVVLAFAYYFHPAHKTNGNIGEISKRDIINCYKWLDAPVCEDYAARIKGMCIIRSEKDTRIVRSNTEAVAMGLRLTLMAMRTKGMLLLPIEFRLPTGSEWLYNSKHRDKLFTPLVKFFLSFHTYTKDQERPTDNPVLQYYDAQKVNNATRSNWFSGLSQSVCMAFSANSASELSIRDFVRMHHRNRATKDDSDEPQYPEFSRSGFPWNKILSAIDHGFPNQMPFSIEQKEQLLISFRNRYIHNKSLKSKKGERTKTSTKLREKRIKIGRYTINKVNAILFPVDIYSMNHDEFYKHCIQIEVHIFSPNNIKTAANYLNWNVDLDAIEYWVKLFKTYEKDKSKKRSMKHVASIFGNLFTYLFFYLPWWFDHNPTTKLKYPVTANDLDPSIYGTRPVDLNVPTPKTFVEFMYDRSEARNIDDNSLYSYMLAILMLFEWLKGRGRRYIKDADNVELLYEHDDLPKSQSRFGTAKNVFPKKLFKTIVSYAYAILEFQVKIQELLENGDITFKDLKGNNGVLDPRDFGINLTALHLGREYEVTQIPSNFLKLPQLLYKDGRTIDTIHIGPVIHNILALETGLRGRHILWLDEATFDSYVQEHELTKDIYPLLVNTDKKGCQWTPFVSRRVITLLRQMRQWKSSIGDPIFHTAVEYTHEKTHYGKIHSVFASNTGIKPGPFRSNAYRDSWSALCLGLQWFCSDHNISDFSFVAYLPMGAKEWKTTYRGNDVVVRGEDDASWADGLHCPVSLRNYVTPHGARATVVSLNISALPADIIGKYITGQTERVVYYYAKFNVEDLNDLHRLQDQQSFCTPAITGNKAETNEADAVMLHCNEVNRKISESVNDESALGVVIDAFGLMSLESLTEKKSHSTGVELLKHSKYSVLGYNDSHICPFGNNCPKEIIDQYGQTMLCGICAYSIKSIDHLPAIGAAKNAAIERLEGLTKTLERAYSSKTTDDELYKIERSRDNQAMDALGWELSEEILLAKVPDIRIGIEEGKYLTFEPEFIKNYLERVHADNDETSYLVARLNECIEYPSLETPHIRARFELAKRKLLASTGDFSSIYNTVESHQPALDLYSLIKSIKETRQISNAELLSLLRTNITELLPEINTKPKLLGQGNG